MIQIDTEMPNGCNPCQPEIIRCKDCKKCITKEVNIGNRIGNPTEIAYFCQGSLRDWRTTPDWFCADGEKRTKLP